MPRCGRNVFGLIDRLLQNHSTDFLTLSSPGCSVLIYPGLTWCSCLLRLQWFVVHFLVAAGGVAVALAVAVSVSVPVVVLVVVVAAVVFRLLQVLLSFM